MAAWYDAFKILTYSLTNDPKSEIERTKNKTGVGISGPDAVPNIRSNDGYFGETGNLKHLKIGTDLIDLSTVSNRSARYKEYERLRSVPEIEQVMTIISDEACISGDEEIETLFYGAKTIKWLAENKKNEEFFVYCWDFEKNDYALGVAYDPRFVKKAMTKKVILDDGTFFIATPDHRVLLSDEQWVQTGDLKYGSTLMPFYRIEPNQKMNEIKNNQFPRIFTHNKGWMHERQFIDEWKTNKDIIKYESINKAIRLLSNGLSIDAVATEMNIEASQLSVMLKNEGFCVKEIRYLAKKEKIRRVIGIIDYKEIDVYDLSVKHFENFCGKSVIFHNCQKDNKKNVLEITCENKEVKKELDFLFLHRKMLNLNRKATNLVKRLCINGDVFWEVIIDLENPKDGILNVAELAPETMFRIETTKGKLLEFQQSSEGPDYESLIKKPVTQSTDLELSQSKALRFTPEQIIHFKLGDDRKTFYPYGQSLIEPARGPAHQLRLMEDSMIVYRLVRAPERRVFYIDTGNMSGHRQEAFISRMQDLLRKKKIVNRPGDGSTALDERWSSPSADEDYWIPIRPNSQTRIDTLPGATNLGEIDDSVYFRNKLYVALNFPPNYFNNEDPGATRMTLSSQNARVARMIERIQEHVEDGLWQIADLHLRLMGFPEETYEDLVIKLTPPSDWRELARMEIESARINNASSLKGSKIYSDWDILTKVMKHSEKDAQEMISRLKNQFLEEAKIQILMQNPDLLGIGVPDSSEEQMGIDGSGPNPMPTPTDDQSSVDNDQQGLGMNIDKDNSDNAKNNNELMPLEEPSEDDIKKYNLAINNYSKEQDSEEPDYSEF